MRNEVKVGILAIISVALSFWGYKYIQGKNILSGATNYYALYEDISGLSVGSAIKISGVVVGSVSSIELDQSTRLVRVDMEVRPGIRIPEGSIAYLGGDGLLGGAKIDLFYSKPCAEDGTGCLPDGAKVEGGSRGMISSFLNTDPSDPNGPITDQIDTLTNKLNATFFGEDSDHPIARSSNDLAATMANLEATTAQLQQLMASNSREINQTMRNLSALTESLASRQEALAGIIDNTESFTGNLSEIELEKTLSEVNQSISRLRGTLDQADAALGGVSTLMSNLGEGKGTLGKLLQDEDIYNRLDQASRSVDTLITDLQERPYRYIPFKSRNRVLKFDRKDAENRAADVSAIPDGK